MPSEKILEQKKQIVADLAEKLKGATAGVLVNYSGINVADDTKLRASMRDAGVDYAVIKNSYIRLAAKEACLEGIEEHLEQNTAMGISASDPVITAKILSEYAGKSKTFKIKAGFVDGKMISADEVNALAKLPSREVLVAKALGGLNAPITGFVYVLNANLSGLARVLNAIAEQKA